MLDHLLRVLLHALDGEEEVRLVLDDRAAQAAAELVLAVLALLGRPLLRFSDSVWELRLLSRKYSNTEPFSSLVPLFVTTLMVPPLARPESARKRWVSKLNSPIESSGKFCTSRRPCRRCCRRRRSGS